MANEVAVRGADDNVIIENARLAFKNFEGVAGPYNAPGDRNFCILLEDDMADMLEDKGWNVKQLKMREEDDGPQRYIQVSIKFRGRDGNVVRPPTMVLITSRGRTTLDEDGCGIFGLVDIGNADVLMRPYRWDFGGKQGTKAYVKALYVTVAEDDLMRKYAHVKEIGQDEQDLELEGENPDDVWDAEVIAEYEEGEQRAIES